MNTSAVVAHYLHILDSAFEGSKWHSLLGNLNAVSPEDWAWVPPDGRRSIRDIVQHIAGAKVIYHNRAFGDGQLPWTDPSVEGANVGPTMPEMVAWLQANHARFRESVAALTDADLLAGRLNHLGKTQEIRWFITTMIEHDLYHAGEINHIRALHQHDDE
jgi:uncharacterized damage-inducible protein DinB